jgi:hypothetical protein
MIPDFTTPAVPPRDSEGAVTFVFDQTATGPTTFAGTFQAFSALRTGDGVDVDLMLELPD